MLRNIRARKGEVEIKTQPTKKKKKAKVSSSSLIRDTDVSHEYKGKRIIICFYYHRYRFSKFLSHCQEDSFSAVLKHPCWVLMNGEKL